MGYHAPCVLPNVFKMQGRVWGMVFRTGCMCIQRIGTRYLPCVVDRFPHVRHATRNASTEYLIDRLEAFARHASQSAERKTGPGVQGGISPHTLASEAPSSVPHSGDSLPPHPLAQSPSITERAQRQLKPLSIPWQSSRHITNPLAGLRCVRAPPVSLSLQGSKIENYGPHCPIRRHPSASSPFRAQEPSDDGDSHERMNGPHIYCPFITFFWRLDR